MGGFLGRLLVFVFVFLAQEILNTFYGAIRIYRFNKAECSLEQAKMSKRKKGGKEAEVAEGKEMEKREKMGDCPHSSGQQVHQRGAQNRQAGWGRGHFSAQGKALLLQSAAIQQLRRK